MILEAARLDVRPGAEAEFEAAFHTASPIIASMPGYLGHELHRCREARSRYLLTVRWRSLEDHTVGFRHRRHTSAGASCCTTSTSPSRRWSTSRPWT